MTLRSSASTWRSASDSRSISWLSVSTLGSMRSLRAGNRAASGVPRISACQALNLPTLAGRAQGPGGHIGVSGADTLVGMVAPRLRKDLGQHHLRQGAVCAPLVEFLAPRGARVLEVGPGGGAL